MSNLFWLTAARMARLQPFSPESHGKPRVDDRRVLSGIIFVNRNGSHPPETQHCQISPWEQPVQVIDRVLGRGRIDITIAEAPAQVT